ncbi:MAG: FkbM family methyltransferase [Pseudomonadota bacterium]
MASASLSDTAEMITCQGVQFPPDPAIITPRVATKLRRQTYEGMEVHGLGRMSLEDVPILELGAGIGFVSSFLMGPLRAGPVTCVEANPALCGYIAQVHRANGLTAPHPINAVCLSDSAEMPESRTLPFHITDPFWSSTLGNPGKYPHETVQVPTRRLSDVIAESGAAMIVCDIEGAETEVFTEVEFGPVERVYLELHTRRYGGEGILRVFNAFSKYGFFYDQSLSQGGGVLFRRLPRRKRRLMGL